MFLSFPSKILFQSSKILLNCPPFLIEAATQQFDNALRDAVSGIVGAPLSEWAWQKASLLVSLGGLGLQVAISHASAAFVGSLSQSANISAAILNLTLAFPYL